VLPPDLLVEYNKSDTIIRIRNIAGGVSALRGFTAEAGAAARRRSTRAAGSTRLAAWQYDSDTWDMAMMGMRLGRNGRRCCGPRRQSPRN
jgi:phage terminase large subunit-like protein